MTYLLYLYTLQYVHAYADDLTFYLASDNPSTLQEHITQDLADLQHWCINISKSHFVHINMPKDHSLFLKLCNVGEKSSTKLFRFIIDNKLTWSDHVYIISNKISSNLRVFYNIHHLLSFATVNNIIVAIFTPTSSATFKYIAQTNTLYKLQKRHYG